MNISAAGDSKSALELGPDVAPGRGFLARFTTSRVLLAFWLVIAVAAGVRCWDLGGLSFWYDEVVTVRLAVTPTPTDLLALLAQIDATRAPLHPLLLQGWLQTFGSTEVTARLFSAACGVMTVAIIGRMGRQFFEDEATGIIAAALSAVSPALVIYAREARMYAWLVLITCIAWSLLAAHRRREGPYGGVAYCAFLVALGYSHPLGLLMIATLALATLVERRALGFTWRFWLLVHGVAALMIAPWLPNYFDHPPESTVGLQPIRMLLGTPIGFLGGNFVTLVFFAGLIWLGIVRITARLGGRAWPLVRPEGTLLLCWLCIPPVVLYVYSRVSHPIFGPERYTLFVAPAFLILVARGIARLPEVPRAVVAVAVLGLAATCLPSRVFAPDRKADWRGMAVALRESDPAERQYVVVASADPAHNVEVETARFYLGEERPVLALTVNPEDVWKEMADDQRVVWFAVGVRKGQPVATLPAATLRPRSILERPGLRLIGVDAR